MGRFLKYLFIGLGIGIVLAIALYTLGVAIEILNCTCAILTLDCDRGSAIPFLWNGFVFRKLITFTIIGGSVVGGISGVVVGIQERNDRLLAWKNENDKKELEQQQHNAEELKIEIANTLQNVYTIRTQANNYKLSPSYVGNDIQQKGWLALKVAYDTNYELQFVIEEINNEEE